MISSQFELHGPLDWIMMIDTEFRKHYQEEMNQIVDNDYSL